MNSVHSASDLLQRRRIASLARRQMGKDSFEAFARIYLPRYFELTASSMHRELMASLQAAARGRDHRIAVAAPRGHAKSTIVSLAYVLWLICYKLESYVLIISSTSGQAEDLLSHIKAELETNAKLLEDFPQSCEVPGRPGGPPRWKQDDIITRSGTRVAALGALSHIRGRRHRQFRPGLIIVDDLESEEQASSADRRYKRQKWFEQSVMKAGDGRTNVVVVGTLLHYDSLLARLIDSQKSPRWQGRKYQAVIQWADRAELWETWEAIFQRREEYEGNSGPDAAQKFHLAHQAEMLKGTKVLWPEKEDYLKLMSIRAEGQPAFDAEKQNEPTNWADSLIGPDDLHWWDDEHKSEDHLLAALKGRCTFYAACDPSLGKAGRHHDSTAIIVLARDTRTGVLYVIDADIRKMPPNQIVSTALHYQKLRGCLTFGFESVQFQEALADEFLQVGNRQGIYPKVKKLKPSTDKKVRIQKLQPMIKSGTIRFCRKHRTLIDQLRQFPNGAHDDGPDALEMAVELSKWYELPPQRVGYDACRA